MTDAEKEALRKFTMAYTNYAELDGGFALDKAILSLLDENAALHREIVALGMDKQDLTSHLESIKQENAELKERIDEVKMQYEGVKLVNIELQSKLNGYKVIYDSLNERYVRVLKDFSSSNKQNARLVAMLRKLEWSSKSESRAPMCPVCYAVYPFSVHDKDCTLGNLLYEIRKDKQ